MDHTIVLSGAIVDHQTWMTSIRSFVRGNSNLSDMQVASANDCNLGKWLNGDGLSEFGQYPEFTELKEAHRKLHGLGAEVVKNKNAGDAAAAEKLIEDMQPLSKKIVAEIEELKTKIS